MLRENSTANNQPINILAVTNAALDNLVPLGRELVAFIDAIVLMDPDELSIARQDLHDAAGPGVVTRAAAVCASFEGTNRVVDAVGVPVNKRYYDIANELQMTIPEHLLG